MHYVYSQHNITNQFKEQEKQVQSSSDWDIDKCRHLLPHFNPKK